MQTVAQWSSPSVYNAIVIRPWHKQFFCQGNTGVEKTSLSLHECIYSVHECQGTGEINENLI